MAVVPFIFVQLLSNLTSGKQLDSPRDEAFLIETLEDGLVLSVPPHFCQQGHRMELGLEAVAGHSGEALVFRAKVKAISSEGDQNEAKIVRTEFYDYDRTAWKRVLRRLSTRQSFIASLLARLKG